jgi:hypothetical protein
MRPPHGPSLSIFTMTNFTSSTQVLVHPFTRQPQGGEIVVGRPELGVFLAIPAYAVDLLDALVQGKTVGEAQDLHRAQYGEDADLPDFLDVLERRGFVQPRHSAARAPVASPSARVPRFHFERVSPVAAQRIFSRPVLLTCRLLIVASLAAIAARPSLLPDRNALYFPEHRFFYALSLVIIGCSAVFLHEMGHLLAARALDVKARLNISHRLWMIVAETDLSGLWSVPKQKRYFPMIAGPLIDMVSASLLILILYARDLGWLHLGSIASRLLPAVLFGYLMRLLWQFFFFVRTDVYYLLSTFFDCKSLLRDTEMFLRGQLARVFPKVAHVDQSAIPEAERRVIRAYSLVWLFGRGLAFGTLFLVTIPVSLKYLFGVHASLAAGFHSHPYDFLDSVAFAALSLAPLAGGLWLWIRSIVRNWSGGAA